MSSSLQPHRLQCVKLPCPSPAPRACLNSCSVEQVMPSNHLILCRPLLFLPSIFPSIGGFTNEFGSSYQVAKVLELSFSISPSSEYSRLISSRMDWLDLLEVQGTLKSLLQQPQFKCINFSALSFLYSPTLTSIHDYWKNHSFD